MSCQQLWLGALTDTSITAVAKLNLDSPSVVLACTAPDGSFVRSPGVASAGNIARMTVTGLTANTQYTCRVEPGSRPAIGLTGSFKTLPAASGTPASFLVAFAGDASERSNHVVFDTIRTSSALMFIHLGDMHYNNVAVNNVGNFRACFDEVFAQSRQSLLYRSMPTAYIWDDHDYGPNNSDATAAGHDASCAAYRERVPYYPLGDASLTAPIYQTFDIGRVRFIMTDERSAASPNSNADISNKTMLGTAQKTWFKNLLSSSAGKLIVWVCSRAFGGVTETGGDHWGGFTTERTEIGAYIKANCPGRVIVLSADAHALAIDDGSHHTYGGEALRTFQAAPLDRSADSVIYGSAQYSAGWFNSVGQYGTMQVVDGGGSSIGITWRGYNSSGTLLVTSAFAISV
jgi:phosphodiesterase/alkaline phosphatase D-like protein